MACDLCGAKGTELGIMNVVFQTDHVKCGCESCREMLHKHRNSLVEQTVVPQMRSFIEAEYQRIHGDPIAAQRKQPDAGVAWRMASAIASFNSSRQERTPDAEIQPERENPWAVAVVIAIFCIWICVLFYLADGRDKAPVPLTTDTAVPPTVETRVITNRVQATELWSRGTNGVLELIAGSAVYTNNVIDILKELEK